MKNIFKISKITAVTLLLFNVSLNGQGFLISEVRTLEYRNVKSRSYSEIEGNPYYTKEFIKSTIFLKDGNYANKPLRYDLFQDEMEFDKDGKVLWLSKKEIKYIRYGGDMMFVTSENADTNNLSYYFLKDDGHFLLFTKKSVIFEPLVPPKGYTATVPERFKPVDDVVFIKEEGRPASRIRNRKGLLDYFADNRKALEFIKVKRIKADRIEDLHMLISYLNETMK